MSARACRRPNDNASKMLRQAQQDNLTYKWHYPPLKIRISRNSRKKQSKKHMSV